jgi:hypothetical protein
MKQEPQVQQAQAQLGGEAQQNQTFEGGEAMQKYLPDDRELWWSSCLGNVSLYVYDYEEGVDRFIELTPFVRIYEKCDCLERFNDIRHNDGGWYHRIIRVFKITPEIYIASYEDTRDTFYADELRYAVVYIGGDAIGKITLKEGEWAELLKREEAEKLIKSYEEDQNYRVYYEE